MHVYAVPEDLRGIVFDIDKTLYSDTAYPEHQEEELLRKLAAELDLSPAHARSRLDEVRRRWAEQRGGSRPSLGNAFLELGVPIEQSVRWRDETFRPEAFLRPDPRLRGVLLRLASRYALATVTNNPSGVGRRALTALGVADLFPVLIGLDTTGVSKPHRKPFDTVCAHLRLPPEHLLSVGDRYDVDLRLPLSMGMGAILVEGVEDVYRLVEEGVVPL
jgi:phosphoglycolate phosphatase/putative hydrolase of the HAD superfamily